MSPSLTNTEMSSLPRLELHPTAVICTNVSAFTVLEAILCLITCLLIYYKQMFKHFNFNTSCMLETQALLCTYTLRVMPEEYLKHHS